MQKAALHIDFLTCGRTRLLGALSPRAKGGTRAKTAAWILCHFTICARSYCRSALALPRCRRLHSELITLLRVGYERTVAIPVSIVRAVWRAHEVHGGQAGITVCHRSGRNRR